MNDVICAQKTPELPRELWLKIAQLMTPQEWVAGPGSACKALHDLEFERMRIKLDHSRGWMVWDEGEFHDEWYNMSLGLKWMTKHFRHLTVLDVDLACVDGGYEDDHKVWDVIVPNVLALRRGGGPNLVNAFRVWYKDQAGGGIENLLDWMLTRMHSLQYLDVKYGFVMFPGTFPALGNLKCLRLVMNNVLKGPRLAPDLLLLPKLEELSISNNDTDDDYDVDYEVDDADFTSRNVLCGLDLRDMSKLVRFGLDQIVSGRVRLPQGCQAFVRTRTMLLDRPLYMQKFNEELIDSWSDSLQHLCHFYQSNVAADGFDLHVLQQFSSIQFLELDGNHESRPSSWPTLEHFSVNIGLYNLPYLHTIRLTYLTETIVTVEIYLPRSIPLKFLEVVTGHVWLSFENVRVTGNMLERVTILGEQLHSSPDMDTLWVQMRGRGYRCVLAEDAGETTRCWYTQNSGDLDLSYMAACNLPPGCRCGLCFECWTSQGRVRMH